MADTELWLETTIVELAEVLDERPSETGYAWVLTARLAERLAPAGVCFMLAIKADRLAVTAASSDEVSRLAALQARLNEGPCIDCLRTGHEVLNAAVTTADDLWPDFAPGAGASGFGTLSALPMRSRGQAIGVIFWAAAEARQLAGRDLRELRVLTRMTAITLAQLRDSRRSAMAAEQLQKALDSRVIIEQAKGAVAARLGVSPDRAFELLRGYARQTNITLADVSSQALSNVLSPHDLMTAAGTRRADQVRLRRVPQSR
jgi:hypothetical protein